MFELDVRMYWIESNIVKWTVGPVGPVLAASSIIDSIIVSFVEPSGCVRKYDTSFFFMVLNFELYQLK